MMEAARESWSERVSEIPKITDNIQEMPVDVQTTNDTAQESSNNASDSIVGSGSSNSSSSDDGEGGRK